MATILKVHGTFASGPEEGDKWWQRGSECCTDVTDLVEADGGDLKIEQVIWDGLNSERSRQAAAATLLERMTALDKAGEPYCVVGHSHGGSVISAALLRAAYYKRPLEKLSRWITIGTPFIEAKRSFLMFSRLGPVGKTLFLAFWASITAGAFMSYRSTQRLIEADPTTDVAALLGKTTLTSSLLYTIIFGVIVSYPVLWLLARRRLHWHNGKARSAARDRYGSRWLSLRHEDDEAVQGLRAFESFREPIFPKHFAVAAFSRSAIVIIPIGIFLLLWGTTYIDRSVTPSPQAVTEKLKASPATPTTPAPSAPSQETMMDKLAPFLAILVAVVFILGTPALMYWLISLLAKPASSLTSWGLNRVTWQQLRASSLGSDIDGESARFARDHPSWLDQRTSPLPHDLAGEITAVSDKAAAVSISKFRAALSELGLFRIEQDGRDVLNAFLTGDELIHTTYFKVPRFRKLLAYAVARSPGFRPSAKLLQDPDLPLIERWYAELATQPPEAAPIRTSTPAAAP